MGRARTIQIYLPSGDPRGLRIAELTTSIVRVQQSSFERIDPSRPALAASGEVDQHLLLGWASGSWRDLAQAEPTMVTAFGAQSLPSIDSPVWKEIGGRWPVADDEPSWRHAGAERPIAGARASGERIADWSPYLLRHTALTKIRERMGVEAAIATAGHSAARIIETYSAEAKKCLARKVAQQLG